MASGWFKLHRQFTESSLWLCEKFTRGQAWVDLIGLANYEDSYFFKRGVRIDVNRGQLARSEVELADRWQWSRTKIRKFLNDLEKEQQIRQQKTNVTQIVTILNYDLYQEIEQQAGQQKNTKKTPKKHIKEEKEYKEEKEEYLFDVSHQNESDKKFENKTDVIDIKSNDLLSLEKWMKENTPLVLRLKTQLTSKNLEMLLLKYSKIELCEVLESMNNYQPLLKKYISVYSTLQKWLIKEYGKR